VSRGTWASVDEACGAGPTGYRWPVFERWTRFVLRFRFPVLAFWLVVLLAGGYGFSKLSALQSTVFSVPGSDSEHVRAILQSHFGDRPDGDFTVVFRTAAAADPATRARLSALVERAARAVPTARATGLRLGSPTVLYGDIVSTLNLAHAKGYTEDLLRALGHPLGTRVYVTGAAPIQDELDPIFSADL